MPWGLSGIPRPILGVGGLRDWKGFLMWSDSGLCDMSSHSAVLGRVSGLEGGIARRGCGERAWRQETLSRLFLKDGGGLVGAMAASGEEDRWTHLESDQVGRGGAGPWQDEAGPAA